MAVKIVDLKIREYCAQDRRYSVSARAEGEVDIVAIHQRMRAAGVSALLMESQGVLVILMPQSTVHVHPNGELLVNDAQSFDHARLLLEGLLG